MFTKIKTWFREFSWRNPVDLIFGFFGFCLLVMFLALVISVL